ncbi:MAG: DUF2288 family protein [Endozoicomonadaceae bacterium]|nr:DUF2288 family protein [Endozoicomonadaceae bacterium]
MPSTPKSVLEHKRLINQQTGKIPWHDLQRYFAAGQTLHVTLGLALIDVALSMNKDDRTLIEQWMCSGSLRAVSDDEAKAWFEQDTSVWAVTIAPWVLVQPEKSAPSLKQCSF